MRKEHQNIIDFLSKIDLRNTEWIKTKWFWKHKKCVIYWNAFEIYYYDTPIIIYDWTVGSMLVQFWWEEYATKSTANMLKDLVEWIFWFKRLPRWNWIIDDYWNNYIFEQDCRLVIDHLYLNDLKIWNGQVSKKS